MKAAVLRSISNIEIEDYSLRTLKQNELLIKVANCGVCGTDRHIFEGKAPSKIPVILGHEYSGIVVEKSKNENRFSIGDKVAINPNIHCGECTYCRRRKIHFCKNLKALGVTLNGGFSEYSIVPSSQVYLLPKELDLKIAAFAEPVSCCLRGIQLAEIKLAETIVIVGGGSIGLIMLQLAKLSGAAKVILIEPIKFKRDLGLKLGADFCLDPNQKNFRELYNDITLFSVDVIIECVGREDTVELSINLASKGSRVVIFGLAPDHHNLTVNLQYLFYNEIKIINSFLNPFLFNDAIELINNRKLKLHSLISKQIPLEEIKEVFSINNNSRAVKYQITNNIKEAA